LVQGVFFRVNTRGQAQALGLHGWVRNLPDRTVEVWAQGPAERVAKLEAWLGLGSPKSRVDAVAAEDVVADPDCSTFEIL
jgi:acylphosphatase